MAKQRTLPGVMPRTHAGIETFTEADERIDRLLGTIAGGLLGALACRGVLILLLPWTTLTPNAAVLIGAPIGGLVGALVGRTVVARPESSRWGQTGRGAPLGAGATGGSAAGLAVWLVLLIPLFGMHPPIARAQMVWASPGPAGAEQAAVERGRGPFPLPVRRKPEPGERRRMGGKHR